VLWFNFGRLEAGQVGFFLGFAFAKVVEGEYSSLWGTDILLSGTEVHACHCWCWCWCCCCCCVCSWLISWLFKVRLLVVEVKLSNEVESGGLVIICDRSMFDVRMCWWCCSRNFKPLFIKLAVKWYRGWNNKCTKSIPLWSDEKPLWIVHKSVALQSHSAHQSRRTTSKPRWGNVISY